MTSEHTELFLKKQKIELLERELHLRENLPFMPSTDGKGCNAHPLYGWQLDFLNSTNQMNFLTAANQIGKSTGGIIKTLRWGYDKKLWNKLFSSTPTMALYFYPDKGTLYREVKEKWEKIYLPKDPLKNDETWGWNIIWNSKREPYCLNLASGLTVYFLSYEQSVSNLQASSVAWVMADEEMPEHIFSEAILRCSRGYYHNFFTATLGQKYLYDTMEQQDTPDEKFPEAHKQQISMYDCLKYADGSDSKHVTADYIEKTKSKLPSDKEIQKRVYGRFVMASGLRFESFVLGDNVVGFHYLPRSWYWYAGLDWGSGGKNHPSAITVVAVCPEFLRGRVVKSWLGKGIKTTQGDVIDKLEEIIKPMNIELVSAFYDYSAADLGITGSRRGLPMVRADKSHDGIAMVNTLFKNRQLKVLDTNSELITELCRVPDDPKADDDDLTDALRYNVSKIPWQFRLIPKLEDTTPEPEEKQTEHLCERQRFYQGIDQQYHDPFEHDEMDDVIDLFGE